MMDGYPGTTGLRRRQARMEARGDAFPLDDGANNGDIMANNTLQRGPIGGGGIGGDSDGGTDFRRDELPVRPQRPPTARAAAATTTTTTTAQQIQQQPPVKFSHLYCVASAVVAFLAIVTSSSPSLISVHSTNINSSNADSKSTTTGGSSLPSNVFFDGVSSSFISSASHGSTATNELSSVESIARAAAIGLAAPTSSLHKEKLFGESAKGTTSETGYSQQQEQEHHEFDLLKGVKDLFAASQQHHEQEENDVNSPTLSKELPILKVLRMIVPQNKQNTNRNNNKRGHNDGKKNRNENKRNPLLAFILGFVDPSILHPRPSSATDIIDKVLTSTPRLLAIANLLLALTYLLHTAVVDMFLGAGESTTSNYHRTRMEQNANNNVGIGGGGGNGFVDDGTAGVAAGNAMRHSGAGSWAGRERLGGFLVFKLLLISAVVVPDTLDLLILLSWYTLLSFLRSLAHLAAATTAHTSQSGQPPRRGVLRLLMAVLISDLLAAAVCVALFHGAGWGMVLLLTCDCALLGVDVLCHILRHASQAMEERHSQTVEELEVAQLELHTSAREAEILRDESDGDGDGDDHGDNTVLDNETAAATIESVADDGNTGSEEEADDEMRRQQNDQFIEESRRIDRRMEILEEAHSSRLSVLDTAVFALQLLAYALTVCHFVHIWSLHGLQFTLIDGVLALHLHSAISSAGKKISERRNLSRIAQDLDGLFDDATELEMRKATAAGDVCCICLGTMSASNVKKIACGHLYHTHCLREVVERARSIEAARCPLCRASVVDGRQVPVVPSVQQGGVVPVPVGGNNANNFAQVQVGAENNDNNNEPGAAEVVGSDGVNAETQNDNTDGTPAQAQQQRQVGGDVQPPAPQEERALFRISTEGILPAWLPVPTFSFEVLRRTSEGPEVLDPPVMPQNANDTNNDNAVQQPQGGIDGVGAAMGQNGNNIIDDDDGAQVIPEGGQQQSFLRRLLVLVGAIPMTPEEEARALEQLVDMFPQYERADLLRELRHRGSAELVADAVILGIFSGVARQGAVAPGLGELQEAGAAPEDDADEYNSLNQDIAFVDGDVQEAGDGL